MGVCYTLVDPVGQKALDIDKQYWVYGFDEIDPADGFTVDQFRMCESGEFDSGKDGLDHSVKARILSWMEAHVEGRKVYAISNHMDCVPPWDLKPYHLEEGKLGCFDLEFFTYPWGEDKRREGWDLWGLCGDYGDWKAWPPREVE